MEYRPCIDIHNGKVKQIVGASLQDEGDQAMRILYLSGMLIFLQTFTQRMD